MSPNVMHLIGQYGYGAVALAVGIESVGIPFPGETTLLAAAIYAGTTHHLSIAGVIAAAAIGAIVGVPPLTSGGVGRHGGVVVVGGRRGAVPGGIRAVSPPACWSCAWSELCPAARQIVAMSQTVWCEASRFRRAECREVLFSVAEAVFGLCPCF